MPSQPDREKSLLKAGRVALVTGASSGIGETFARALGARGLHLILTGLDEDRLRSVADEIAAAHQVRVERVVVDLTEPDGPEQVKAAVDRFALVPDILVNNAGAARIGSFAELPQDEQLDLIRLNVEALVAMTSLFLPAMLDRGRGGIVNVGSAAGLQPLPHYAVYGATKAFVNSFSQALWAEVRGRGVRVTTLCPGPVAGTRLGERAGGSSLEKLPLLANWRRMTRERVVGLALRGLERGDPLIVTGLANQLLSGVAGLAPRRLQLVATERIFRPHGASVTPLPAVNFPIGPGTRAIVTGASWGVGETFAQTLAARGADVLLVARGEERLRALADALTARYGVRVEIAAVDLGSPDGPRQIVEAADRLGFEPTLLVNNAGIGVLGPFAELPLDKAREIVRLNVLALTDLTYRVLAKMRARGTGAIINIGSASAFQPLPNYGAYAASKAFVFSLSSALWAECRHQGIHVVTVCPGAVDANDAGILEGAAPSPRRLRRRITRGGVVASALQAVERGQPIIIPGGPPAVARLVLDLVPRQARLRITGLLLGKFPTMLTGTRRRDA